MKALERIYKTGRMNTKKKVRKRQQQKSNRQIKQLLGLRKTKTTTAAITIMTNKNNNSYNYHKNIFITKGSWVLYI